MRRRILPTQTVSLPRIKPARTLGTGAAGLMIGFGLIILTGTLLLWMPYSDADGQNTGLLEALFTAVSAICVTGLVVVDTQTNYNFFGEAVILVLIQVGGLGYMMGTSIILWALGRQLGLKDRHMLRVYYGAPSMGETLAFAKRVAMFAFAFEAVGAVILYVAFLGTGLAWDTSIWWALFHSLSAFNNAGFNLTSADMLPYRDDPGVLMTLAGLVILGGLGAVPVLTLFARRSWVRLPLDHKLIFGTTALLLTLATGFFLVGEWDKELAPVAPGYRPFLAFFQAVVPRTAGFSAIDTANLDSETKLANIGLMFVGGAAGSTAGGLKVGAFALLFVAILATVRGREEVTMFRRAIPPMIVRQALTLALLFVAMIFGTAMALLAVSDFAFDDVLFETVSAVCTVGTSTGITSGFGTGGRLILIVAMLVGRFGPLLLVLEMNRPRKQPIYRTPEDGIRLG